MLNWTSSAETVAPDAPVTLHRSNRSASDTPVLYHSGMGRAMPRLREKSKVAPVTRVVLIEASVQAPCHAPESMSSWREDVSSAPDEPVVHKGEAPV